MNIITTSKVQQKIGNISASIGKKWYIVTNRGEGKIIMLPYFDGCDKKISEYMEEYEMAQNKNELKKRYADAEKSGVSSLMI